MTRNKLREIWAPANTCWLYAKLWRHKLWRLVHNRRQPLALFISLALASVSVWLVAEYWNWLASIPSQGERESYSTTLRNVALLFGGVLALALGYWRGWAADRQAKIAQEDVLDQRYQKGIEELGSTDPTKRLGGIYELQRLAEEYPRQYHVPIMRRLCAALRGSTDTNSTGECKANIEPPHVAPKIKDDIQALIDAIGSRSKEQFDLEGKARFQIDLRNSDLRHAKLSGANLSSAPWSQWTGFSRMELLRFSKTTDFSNAKLCSAWLDLAYLKEVNFDGACLCGAYLIRTNLSGAHFAGSNLHEALSWGPILSGAKFSINGNRPAKGIKQSDLNDCFSDPNNLPDLTGVRDAETNKPLQWSGKSLEDDL